MNLAMHDCYRVIILPEASHDLRRIFSYIEGESPQNAVTVIQRLMDEIDSLDLFPHRYEVHKSNRNPERIVRSMAAPPYIIYYRVLESSKAIEVITIRHGR